MKYYFAINVFYFFLISLYIKESTTNDVLPNTIERDENMGKKRKYMNIVVDLF